VIMKFDDFDLLHESIDGALTIPILWKSMLTGIRSVCTYDVEHQRVVFAVLLMPSRL
jgi:hypothetical protein